MAWVAERETQFEGMDIPAIILREIREEFFLKAASRPQRRHHHEQLRRLRWQRSQITIGPLDFAKKSDALAYLKTMLHRYDVGDKVERR